MKYAVEMGSGALVYIPSLLRIYLGIRKLRGGAQTHVDLISLLLCVKNKEIRLKYF
jgi:hypothetical protein